MAFSKMVGLEVMPLSPSSRTRRANSPVVSMERRIWSYQTLCPNSPSWTSGFIRLFLSTIYGSRIRILGAGIDGVKRKILRPLQQTQDDDGRRGLAQIFHLACPLLSPDCNSDFAWVTRFSTVKPKC